MYNTATRYIFALAKQMVIVAQLVRASDCGSEGRGFETHHSPQKANPLEKSKGFFVFGKLFSANYAVISAFILRISVYIYCLC